jgi:hypothetical protein
MPMSEPTTKAGRKMLLRGDGWNLWVAHATRDDIEAAILAIEQEARRKALAEVRAAIEELDPEDSMRPNDPTDESWDGGFYSGRNHAVAALDDMGRTSDE